MEAKEPFGSQYAKTFDIGDIVTWSHWCSNSNSYVHHTGKISSINESKEIELFTMNLKVISKAKKQ